MENRIKIKVVKKGRGSGLPETAYDYKSPEGDGWNVYDVHEFSVRLWTLTNIGEVVKTVVSRAEFDKSWTPNTKR